MGKWVYTHNGYKYTVEADDETSADEKFNNQLKQFSANDSDAKKAKDEAQNKAWDDKLAQAQTPWEKTNAGMNAVFGRANRSLEDSIPGLKTAKEIVNPSLMKGVPIARHYVPQTEALSNFESEHPNVATGLRVAGGATAMLPLAGGAAAVSGARFMPQLAGQLAVNAPAQVADKMAEKGTLNLGTEDASKAMQKGILESLLPASVSKLFGQTARTAHPALPGGDAFQTFMRPGGHRLPSGAPSPSPWGAHPYAIPGSQIPGSALAGISPATSNALHALAGGATGYHLGDSTGAALLGLIGAGHVAPALAPFERAIGHIAAHPSTQDILRALSAQGDAPKMLPPVRQLLGE